MAGKRNQMLLGTSPKLTQITRTVHLPCLTVAADSSARDRDHRCAAPDTVSK